LDTVWRRAGAVADVFEVRDLEAADAAHTGYRAALVLVVPGADVGFDVEDVLRRRLRERIIRVNEAAQHRNRERCSYSLQPVQLPSSLARSTCEFRPLYVHRS
jgi:hypothetical protein